MTSVPSPSPASASSTGCSIVIPIVAGIGNALLAVPMVRALKRTRPDARITILARIDAMGEVFRRLAEVSETIVTGTGGKGVIRMIAEARRRRPDVYLVPFPSNRWQYALLAATSRARQRVLHAYPVGYWRAMHFIGSRIPAVRGLHDVEQNLRLLSALGIDSPTVEPPVFPLRDNDRAAADTLLTAAGIAEPFIAIHAGSARTILAAAKRWPPPRYAELIAALPSVFGGQVVLLEGPDEAGVADGITRARAGPRAGPRPGATATALRLTGPLGESAAVLERAALYVGSDSGLGHLAAAVGTRAVTLFAPADPDRVCPYGNRDLVVQAPTSCTPCFLYPWQSARPKMRCRAPLCIETITVDQVLSAVRRALGTETPVTVSVNGASA